MAKGEGKHVSKHPKTWKFEELWVGQSASYEREVQEFDIIAFAKITGDENPLHLDPEFAKKTRFGQCIAHGVLSLGYVSAVFGMTLPGPGAIFVGFDKIRFTGPVLVGQRVTAKATVYELFPEKRHARFDFSCFADGKSVLTGEATLKVPA